MPIAPPVIDTLPTVPTRTNRLLFATLADAFYGAQPTYRVQLIALGDNVYSNAVEVANNAAAVALNAVSAASSANAAALSAGAVAWVSGTNYPVGVRVISPTDAKVYRRIVAGAGTTSPTLDNVNWESAEPKGASDFVLQSFGII